jgi:hypothetical protein
VVRREITPSNLNSLNLETGTEITSTACAPWYYINVRSPKDEEWGCAKYKKLLTLLSDRNSTLNKVNIHILDIGISMELEIIAKCLRSRKAFGGPPIDRIITSCCTASNLASVLAVFEASRADRFELGLSSVFSAPTSLTLNQLFTGILWEDYPNFVLL